MIEIDSDTIYNDLQESFDILTSKIDEVNLLASNFNADILTLYEEFKKLCKQNRDINGYIVGGDEYKRIQLLLAAICRPLEFNDTGICIQIESIKETIGLILDYKYITE